MLWLIMACSMFPLVVLLPPLLKMFSSTAPFTWFPYWINTYQSVILPGLSFGLPLAVWTLTAFFKQLPVELGRRQWSTAARQGGVPQGDPAAGGSGRLHDGDHRVHRRLERVLASLTFLQDKNRQTATVAISKFTGTTGFDTPYGTIMAAGVVVTVPLLLAVLIFQRRIVAWPHRRWRQVAVLKR